MHRRLGGPGGGARTIGAAAGLCGGHVPPRPLRPHRHRPRRGHGREMSERDRHCEAAEGRRSNLRHAYSGRLLRFARNDGRLPRISLRSMRATASLLIAAVLLLTAAAAWIVSLRPPPLGEGLAFSTLVLDREGRLLRPFATPEGRWRLPARPDGVDPRYLDVLLAYEDKRFYAHHGVDPLALLRAFGQFARDGRIVSGGSTITMQVARLLEPRGERSVLAKLRQIVRAIELERELSKDEILALYLSLAPYGGNLEGLRAAALAYFGKEPRRLTLGEAALLVALPQSPEARRPDRAPEAARRARDRVLDRLAAQGVLDPAEIARAKAEPVPSERKPMPSLAPHAAEPG